MVWESHLFKPSNSVCPFCLECSSLTFCHLELSSTSPWHGVTRWSQPTGALSYELSLSPRWLPLDWPLLGDIWTQITHQLLQPGVLTTPLHWCVSPWRLRHCASAGSSCPSHAASQGSGRKCCLPPHSPWGLSFHSHYGLQFFRFWLYPEDPLTSFYPSS